MYFITTIRIEQNKIIDFRCWGYYPNKENCVKTLYNNDTDMHEYYYNYAVIEKIEAGISSQSLEREFFQYAKEFSGFLKIKEPNWAKHYCNFSIG